jgi:hypothetical protein
MHKNTMKCTKNETKIKRKKLSCKTTKLESHTESINERKCLEFNSKKSKINKTEYKQKEKVR